MNTPATTNSGAATGKLRYVLRGTVIVIALLYLGHQLYADSSTLAEVPLNLAPSYLAISCILLLLSLLACPLGWRLILLGAGTRITPKQAWRIWFITNLGRYVPGKIWHVVGRVDLGRSIGIPAPVTIASFIYEMVLAIGTGLLISLSVLPLLNFSGFNALGWFITLFVIIAIVIYPPVFTGIINFLLRLTKRPALAFHLSLFQVAGLGLFYLAFWSIQGAGFFFLVKAITPVAWAWLWPLIGIFVGAWVLGFLSFVSPGGLGVREGVMVLLLGTLLPAGVAVVIAVVARLWITCGELILVLLSTCWRRK